jgi:hypothetical protein
MSPVFYVPRFLVVNDALCPPFSCPPFSVPRFPISGEDSTFGPLAEVRHPAKEEVLVSLENRFGESDGRILQLDVEGWDDSLPRERPGSLGNVKATLLALRMQKFSPVPFPEIGELSGITHGQSDGPR